MMSAMDELDPTAKKWLSKILDAAVHSHSKHIHSQQDEVYP